MLSLCKSLSTGQCNILVPLIVIHWIVIYPVDSAIQLLNNWGLWIRQYQANQLCYPLDSDLSSGQGYTAFEQLGPGLNVTNNLPLSKTTPLKKYNTIIFSLKNICQGENHFNINSCYIETPSLKERFVANNMTKFFLSTSLQCLLTQSSFK